MKTKFLKFLLVPVTLLASIQFISCSTENKFANRDKLFSSDWRFFRGDAENAELPDFDDSGWRTLDLPHDWSIEDLPENPVDGQVGPFSKQSPGKSSTGHVLGGTGWYRKTFALDKSSQDKIVSILFDGVYMESIVWVNGCKVGYHPNGYTPFYYDITPYLNPTGEQNIIAVKVENLGENSRWYSGSGIYRHVWLTVTHPVHVAQWGNDITTPEILGESATINIVTTLQNDNKDASTVQVITTIFDANRTALTKGISGDIALAQGQLDYERSIKVESPELWTVDSPALYTAQVDVKIGDKLVDRTKTTFGIRSIEFSPEKGFLLNGEQVLLKGGNMHHDNGPLGAAAIDRAEERRVELMKQYGFNAVRTSHNPPSQQFLDACDRLGLLVMDEAFDMWQRPKKPQDYHRFFDEWHEKDLTAMLLRDRNHPSIIMWSFGNEISERGASEGLQISQRLIDIIKKFDTTRPATQAICRFWEDANKDMPWEATAPAFAQMDVHGYNYQWERYEEDHAAFPDRVICGTESVPSEAFENWQQVEKHSYVIGDFVWTAMDYIGEASIGHAVYEKEDEWSPLPWPWFNANCGDIDVCGFKKPQSYYRDVVWGISNLEMAVHEPTDGRKELVSYWGWPQEEQNWTWPDAEGQELLVKVYSSYPKVRLELNGEVIGTKDISKETKLTATFQVPYTPGELKVIGLQEGNEVETKSFTTTGEPAGIRLAADRASINADRSDLAYVTVEVIDEHNERVPNVELPIRFSITGDGVLAGVGNGNPANMKSFQTPECKTFRGRCLVILRPTGGRGEITLTAEAEGMRAAKTKISIR